VSTEGARRAPSLICSPAPPHSPVYPYHVFGQRLVSQLPFPELRDAPPGPATWTFRLEAPVEPPTQVDGSLLGQQTIYPGCQARLFGCADGWRIVVDDTGIYDLRDGGRDITWTRFPLGTPDFGRAHFLGRVLSTAMHFGGGLVLHGSAVSYPAGAVVFLAPKHTGKSTLALALTQAGARLITDDTITVAMPRPGTQEVWPGVHSLRLLPDTVERLQATPRRSQSDGKILVTDLRSGQLEEGVRPVAAIYLLAAAKSITGGGSVARRPVPQPLAAAALVGQGKISEMLGAAEAPVLLQRAARLASQVPVYRLAVQRDFDRLHEVAAQVAEWHSLAPGHSA
jgi:hypothetical protein